MKFIRNNRALTPDRFPGLQGLGFRAGDNGKENVNYDLGFRVQGLVEPWVAVAVQVQGCSCTKRQCLDETLVSSPAFRISGDLLGGSWGFSKP